MSEYKKFKTTMGIKYTKDKQFVGKANIPPTVLSQLETNELGTLIYDGPVPRLCVFCGIQSTRRRFINLKEVILCDDHYFNKSTGEVVQQLREPAPVEA